MRCNYCYHVGTAALAGVLVAMTSVQGAVNVSPAATVNLASMVSNTISPSYIGMGIEPSNMFAFLGTTSPNTLTNNLLSNLANYTGIPPHIRIGGNTQDTTIWSPTFNGYFLRPNPSSTSNSDSTIFGPKYFDVINNLPNKTPVSLGIGMAYNGSDAVNMTVAIAQQAITSLTNVNLVALEVGNEPDLYILNGFRPSGWSITDYGNEWIERVEAIYNQVLKPANIGTAFFEAACTATTAAYPDYKISNLVNTGVGTNNGAYLAGWNQHDYYYYVGVSDYTLTLSELLQLSTTSGQFTVWTAQAAEAAVTGKPYYVREMGSVGPAGIQGISNTFANAIWTLNFFLFAATVGVDSVQMHMLQSSYGSPWQPITDTDNANTFVRPSYYGFAAMNQIIGAKCATKVAQMSLSNYPSSYGNRLAVYSIYDGNNLQSLVLLNTQVAYSGSNSIGSQDFVISLPTLVGKTFYLSVMTAAGADATSNVTWNGMSYEQSGDGSPTTVSSNFDSVNVGSDGTLTVTVRDSQIVVANLGSVLGTQNNVVDTSVCAALAATTSEGGASSPTSGKGAAPTFKSTTGFQTTGLSMAAIIGIAAGGGSALIILLGIIICCCVRRSRKNKAKKVIHDDAALLPPSAKRSYANVPQRDSLDSSADHDIWMLPLGAKKNHNRYDSGSSTPYKGGYHSRGGSGTSTPYKHDSQYRNDSSYDNSLYEAPLNPNNNNMREYAPQSSDGHGYRNVGIPVSASMPLTAAEQRRSFQAPPDQRRSYQAQPAVSSRLAHGTTYPEEPIQQRGRLQSQPDRPHSLIPGQQQYESRQRQSSTPARPDNVPNQAQPQRSSNNPRPREAAYGAARRSPSAPDSRSLPGSRHHSPNRGADRIARSNQGHQSRRSGFENYDAPPVPQIPDFAAHSQRPAREPMPSRSANHAQVGGPRQQPSPARFSANQYHHEPQYDYSQQDTYPSYHAQ